MRSNPADHRMTARKRPTSSIGTVLRTLRSAIRGNFIDLCLVYRICRNILKQLFSSFHNAHPFTLSIQVAGCKPVVGLHGSADRCSIATTIHDAHSDAPNMCFPFQNVASFKSPLFATCPLAVSLDHGIRDVAGITKGRIPAGTAVRTSLAAPASV